MARTKKQDVDQSQEKRESEKPKRVLTEAQRLAFLKGREKRMANIEMKKSMQQQDSETIQSSVSLTKTKTKPEDTIEDKTTQESLESMEEVVSMSGCDEDDDIPTLQLQPNKRPKEKSNPITKANPKTQPKSNSNSIEEKEIYEEDDDEHDITARKIADYVFDRLKMLKDDVKREEQNMMDVGTMPTRPARVRSKSMTTKKQSSSLSTSGPGQSRKTRSAPPEMVEPAPQRIVNWM